MDRELVAALLEELRAVRVALERQASALERIAVAPSRELAPSRPGRRGRVRVPTTAAEEPEPLDELTRARARRLLSRAGIEVG